MGHISYADLPVLDTEVLVVGAGPTGLMAALTLGRVGVGAVVVDPKSGPTRESRALAVQPRTMEIYDQLGLAERVEAEAVMAPQVSVGTRRAPLPFAELQAGATRFPGIRVFEQSRNEAMLAEALAAQGGPVLWQHRLISFIEAPSEESGVTALVESVDGLLRVRARWCLGADGAGSLVRRLLDLPFEGVTDEALFWVADVRGASGVRDDAVSFRFGTELFCVAFPLGPDGHVRLIALAPGIEVTPEEALGSLRRQLGIDHRSLDWFSTYRVHHRCATRFRVGPVFLAGDAAHVHSPVGGQGMNTGLQDAHHLALTIADVRHGRAEPAALDRYEAERRPVARHLVSSTDRAFGLVARRGRLAGLLRLRGSALPPLLFGAVRRLPVGRVLAGWLGQYRIRYHFTAADRLPSWAEDPLVGRRLPPAHDNQLPLRALAWQWHTYGGVPVEMSAAPEWIEGPHHFAADATGRLRPDRAYLVRSDGFVAAAIPRRGPTPDAAALDEALRAHRLAC